MIKETTLIIRDEASLEKKENLESLDLLLRDLCDPNLLFGGKIVVFGGDFRQVLPVLPQKTQREVVAAILVTSTFWPQLIKFRRTENIRARDDPTFSEFLLSLGNGELQTVEDGLVRLPDQIVNPFENGEDPMTEITAVTFPELDLHNFSSDIFTTRAILTPLNDDVDFINTTLIEKFLGERVLYRSFDTMLDDNCNIYPTEFINTFCPGGMSPHELVLKENNLVIFLCNILSNELRPTYCNPTRGS